MATAEDAYVISALLDCAIAETRPAVFLNLAELHKLSPWPHTWHDRAATIFEGLPNREGPKQGLAYEQVLDDKLELGVKLALEQPCEQELGRRKQFLRIQLQLHFLNRHQQYCM